MTVVGNTYTHLAGKGLDEADISSLGYVQHWLDAIGDANQ